jgi:hypothetical protein
MADVAIEMALEPKVAPVPDAAHLFCGKPVER